MLHFQGVLSINNPYIQRHLIQHEATPKLSQRRATSMEVLKNDEVRRPVDGDGKSQGGPTMYRSLAAHGYRVIGWVVPPPSNSGNEGL